MTKLRFTSVFCALLCIGIHDARAQLALAQWNFNSIVPDANNATGSVLPSFGSGSASTIGGVTAGFAAGSPRDVATDNTAWSLGSWPAATVGSGTAGVQFMASTLGILTSIQISFDLRQSATASERFQLQATTDGVTFSNVSGGVAAFGAVGNNIDTSFSATGLYINTVAASNQAFVQNITYTFAAGSPFQNDLNFGFRLLSVFDGTEYDAAGLASTYGASGTLRIDMVAISTIQAVPEPAVGAVWVAALMGVASAARRYRRSRATLAAPLVSS